MILKSLLLQGFKSFPDKTEIRFLGGMTVIVGPNGSGKSNISDAIRWVLGEQSTRSLRGAKMEDVIFGGTARRGPLGFAEVSLILDNASGIFRSEYIEIMVTRRYYRSGESAYYLNKQQCLLRDIHELFMDTGLGRDGYSIIGQGRIDEILSLKSEDRREVFEEAAGITKFRYRKEEAERKLCAAADNLVRINDLYGELENQIEPLEKQAEKAKKYLALRDALRVLEVSLWLQEQEKIRADFVKMQENQRICTAQLAGANAELAALYTHAEQLTAEMHQADAKTDGLRRDLRVCEQHMADAQRRCAVLETNIANDQENIVRAQRGNARQAEQADALRQQQDTRRARCKMLDNAWEELERETAQVQAQADAQQAKHKHLTQALDALDQQLARQAAAHFQLELTQSAAQAELDGMGSRRETVASAVKAAEDRLARELRIHEDHKIQLDECRKRLGRERAGLCAAEKQMQEHLARTEAQTAALTRQKTALRDCENHIRMLREMQKDYEGFSRAVKMLMKRKDSGAHQGLHGPVSALLTVPDAYVTAVETALGAASSHLVVETAQDAKNAIQDLHRRDGGRATFLPMDTIRPVSLREQGFRTMAGCYGTADTLIHCADQYRAVMQSLLGRTVVAEDMDTALRLAKAYRYRFRIVTKDGQMIQPGGAMTGGSVSKTAGTLARAGRLRALERARKEMLAQAKQTESEGQDAQALSAQAKAAHDQCAEAAARCQEEEARLVTLLSQHDMLLDSVSAQAKALQTEQDDLAQRKTEHERAMMEKAKALQTGHQQKAGLEAERAALQDAMKAAQLDIHLGDARLAMLRTAAAENRTEKAAEQRALEEIHLLHKEMQAALVQAEQALYTFTEQICRYQAELSKTEEEIQQDGKQADVLRVQIGQSTQRRMQLEAEKTLTGKQIQTQNEEILDLEREHARLEALSEQLKERETQILTKMWESYELTPTPAAQMRIALPDRAQAERQAAALREQIRGLGHVYLGAAEEYTALMERFTFLRAQKEDLETAQHTLAQAIEELTVKMKEMFASAFAKLNTYFGEIFREIFGGGHARLQLADTADILNCGIDILVCPPGKAVKTLTLLSGGEKAFVAIALYFSILKLRPTPFSVLDEIEAALDDVNVGRFAAYVRRLSESMQFIIITHRRGTMEAADTLYGVTMQEQGVSRMLMLNLAEAEKKLGQGIR